MESFFKIEIKTSDRAEFVDVTGVIGKKVAESGVLDGVATAFVPHTTAGITINENADPDVVTDIIGALERKFPHDDKSYRHSEGNSDAHIKASLLGSSVSVIIKDGRLCFGTWQAVYFCEFDGPRRRELWIKIM
jgi:secondary thiamine-phosphate synthase enzyme